MKSNKNKLRKVLTTSLIVGMIAGARTNAGLISGVSKIGGSAFALKFIWDSIGKNIYEKFTSTPIAECKISDIGFDNIYVFDGQISAATFNNSLCFLNNLMQVRNMFISSSENGHKMYYGTQDKFSEAVEEINHAYLNGEIQGVFAVNYFDLGNGNNGSLARTINYYVDTKKPEDKRKLQVTSDTLFRFENENLSFKIKNADVIKQLNNDMAAVVDNSVSQTKLNSSINYDDIEIIEKPMEETYNLKRRNTDKNARINSLKQNIINALNKNSLFFCQVPNEDLVLIKLGNLTSQTGSTNNFKPGFETTDTPYESGDNSAPLDGSVNYPTLNEIDSKNSNNNNKPTPSNEI